MGNYLLRGGIETQWLLEKSVITGTMNTTSIVLAQTAPQMPPRNGNFKTLQAVERLGGTKNAHAEAKRNISVAMVNEIST
mgnify:CR=1 FL=1